MSRTYLDFLTTKHLVPESTGFEVDPGDLNPALFPWQRAYTAWELARGKGAGFAGCGLGKTLIELEWARQVVRHTGGDVLHLTPLAVAGQTVREAEKFGIEAKHCRGQADVRRGITVTNYESLHKFDTSRFVGVVLDESSILKSFMGRTKRALVQAFAAASYRLPATATPAPNDVVELGNHAEFLGVMNPGEMLTRFFINDTKQANNLRLKKHAVGPFWSWVSSWALCVTKPSDIGFSDDGYDLPPLITREVLAAEPEHDFSDGRLVPRRDFSAANLHRELRQTVLARAEAAAAICLERPNEPAVIWCNANYEADALRRILPAAVEVRGSMDADRKERILEDFSGGNIQYLVTKPIIAGFGLNWQHCRVMVSMGLAYSFEQRYQAIRRCWRFGQIRDVYDYVVMAPSEAVIFNSVKAKEANHREMERQIAIHMSRNLASPGALLALNAYRPGKPMRLPEFLSGRAA